MNSQIKTSNEATPLETPEYGTYRTLWGDAVHRLARNKLALAGGFIVLLMLTIAIFAPLITPFNPNQQDSNASLESPSASHIMGTDILGRDTFSRLIFGARISLAVGIFTQFIILIIIRSK